MKTKKKLFTGLIALAALLLVGGYTGFKVYSEAVNKNVSMAISASTVEVGQTVDVTVSINSPINITTFISSLKYDASKFRIESVTGRAGTADIYLVSGEGAGVVTAADTSVPGVVGFYSVGRTADATVPAGTLYKATFTALDTGTASFALLEDSDGADGFKNNQLWDFFNGSTNVEINEREIVLAHLKSATLGLEGEIVVRFTVVLDESFLADEAAYAEINGIRTLLRDATPNRDSQGNIVSHYFYYRVAAKQMTDPVTISFYDGQGHSVPMKKGKTDEMVEEYSYSAQTYIDKNIPTNAVGSNTRNLLEALNDYGSYAQTRFSYNTQNAKALLRESEIAAISPSDLTEYEYSKAGAVPGIKSLGATPGLEACMVLRFTITLDSGYDVSDFTYSIDGDPVTPYFSGTSDKYYVEVNNILAKDIDRMFSLRISDGENEVVLRYGVLSYVLRQISNPSTDIKQVNICKAIYYYNQKADKFFAER